VENLYGPTELTINVSWHRWQGEESAIRGVNGTVPIGKIHDELDFLLMTEHGERSSVDGELWVSGPQMAIGYLDPADEEGRFVELDDRRRYQTGDRVSMTDGELSFVGRIDSQVKVHGWRVELAEVDHAVRQCDGVHDAVTVARSAQHWTELVVFYTGDKIPRAELVSVVRELLPHSILPRQYVHLEHFPLNPNRKVDRLALRRRAEDMMSASELWAAGSSIL